jgi:hypothetical protein
MRHKDDTDATLLQSPHSIKQAVNVGAGKRRGRLVKNDNRYTLVDVLKRTRDSDTGPLGSTKGTDWKTDVDVEANVEE